MRFFLSFLLFCCFCSLTNAQASMAEIVNSSRSFEQIIRDGEAYFAAKHPGVPFAELAFGEERDGEYVKFRRWQHFWAERLNPDGTLGDPSKHFREADRNGGGVGRSVNPYANIDWTEINYTNYITGQIGLGRATSMAFHPTNKNIFYVGAAIGGIWRTTDGGQSYTPLGDDLPFMAVSSIVVDQNNPSTIYIAISDHVWYGPPGLGIYKSTDGGQSWLPTALSFNFTDNVRISWMEADPNDPNTLLVAAENGLYRTTNGFSSVTKVSSISSFHVRYQIGSSQIVYLGSRNGRVYRSSNGGVSFTETQNFGGGDVHLDVSVNNPLKVMAKVNQTFYLSMDGGFNFTATGPAPDNSDSVFKMSLNNDNDVLFGWFEIYGSNDNGATNTVLTNWLGNGGLPLIHVDQRNIFVNPLEPDAVYFCNDGGLYRYNISSDVFDNLCDGLAITQYYDIAVSQTDVNVIGGGSQDNGNVFRESNGQWQQYASTGDGMNQDIDPTDASIRYWAYQNGGMRRWQNGTNVGIAPPGQDFSGAWETPYKVDPNNPARLIAGFDKVYESLNRGDSWTEISGQLAGGSNLQELAIAPSNSNRIYATQGSNLYVKDISSNNWTTKSLPASISDIEVDFQNMDIVYISVPGYSSGSKVYKSTDAGDNWTNISGNLPNVSTGALELVEGTIGGVFVGNDQGVWYKDDQAQVWLEYGDLPNTRVEDIEIQYSGQLIRVGTHGRGVLEAPLQIQACTAGSPDGDGDGFCDFIDQCPVLNNNLIGTACDDSDPFSQGELYDLDCGCSGGAAFVDYCAANGNGASADWINNVSIGDLDHGSGKTGYSDFRHIGTALTHGQSYTLEVSLNFTFAQDRVYAWIDFDRNETFDADERIDLAPPVNNKAIATVTIPLDAVKGAVTMRVRNTFFNLDQPCGSSAGEVEDYTLSLVCTPSSTNAQCTGVVPVDWVNFSAEAVGKSSALLLWQTANEIDLAHYQVERSLDGRSFETIAQTQPQQTARANYSYLDEGVNAQLAYYRIRAVDFDGSSQTTPVQEVNWTDKVAGIQISPNPTTDQVAVSYHNQSSSASTWKILGTDGRLLKKGSITPGQWTISVIDLPAGVYILQIGEGPQQEQQKFVKQ